MLADNPQGSVVIQADEKAVADTIIKSWMVQEKLSLSNFISIRTKIRFKVNGFSS